MHNKNEISGYRKLRGKDMGKKTLYIYFIIVSFFLILLLYIGNTFSVEISMPRTERGYEKVEDWTREIFRAGEGGFDQATAVYHMRLPEEIIGKKNIAIYSIHQNIRVFVGEEEVYSIQWQKGRNAFGKTPGIRWSFIDIIQEDSGKEVTVHVTSSYADKLTAVPEFYIGDKEAVAAGVIKKDLYAFFVSLGILLMGIILIIFWFVAYRSSRKNSNLLYLGVFSVILAVWLLNELKSTVLIFSSPLVCSYISFISLLLLPIPFTMCAKELFYDKSSVSWKVLYVMSIVAIGVAVILQVLDIKDLRETVALAHIMILSVFLVTIYHIIREIITIGFNRRLKLNIAGITCCAAAGLLDIVVYYMFRDRGQAVTMFCATTFLIYVSVLSVMAMRETYSMLEKGKLANQYEKMAYHDQLTNLYNRAAYEELVGGVDVNMNTCAIVMFDLNDLKKCNDVYGHAAGDSYIMLCAKMISEVFGNIGTCCRIGGDEFCAIVPEEKVPYCEKALSDLDKRVDEANKQEREYEVHIAYGYAVFDKELDKELSDTRSRADANMYRMKFAMKGAAGRWV